MNAMTTAWWHVRQSYFLLKARTSQMTFLTSAQQKESKKVVHLVSAVSGDYFFHIEIEYTVLTGCFISTYSLPTVKGQSQRYRNTGWCNKKKKNKQSSFTHTTKALTCIEIWRHEPRMKGWNSGMRKNEIKWKSLWISFGRIGSYLGTIAGYKTDKQQASFWLFNVPCCRLSSLHIINLKMVTYESQELPWLTPCQVRIIFD